METREYKVYKFKELPKEAQQKVIKNYNDINVDHDNWSEFILDDKKEELEKLGYNEVEINYSGFWSQGDGASFTAKSIDIQKWLKAHKLTKKYSKIAVLGDFTGSITRSNYHYYYATSTNVNIDANNDYCDQRTGKEFSTKIKDAISDLQQFLEKAIEDEREEQGDEIYKYLQECYEDATSEKSIIETFEANDYNFTIDGKID